MSHHSLSKLTTMLVSISTLIEIDEGDNDEEVQIMDIMSFCLPQLAVVTQQPGILVMELQALVIQLRTSFNHREFYCDSHID